VRALACERTSELEYVFLSVLEVMTRFLFATVSTRMYHAVACVLRLCFRQILEHMVGKIFEAEIAATKRLLLSRFLKASQIMLLLLNILTIGFMITSGVYNVRAGNQYSQSAAKGRMGDKINAKTLVDVANDTDNQSNIYEGVSDPLPSPQSFGCRSLCTPLSMHLTWKPSSP
jgi:hypothetical protein